MRALPCLAVMALLVGCGKSPEANTANEFFVQWLKLHGETNIVEDSRGVGVAGNKTRFNVSTYGTEASGNGYSVELEFRITLPAGGPIIEYVAGTAETGDKAAAEARANFALTTAHVIYKAFINPTDEHQPVKSIVIRGKPRELYAGNMIQFGEKSVEAIDLESMSRQVQDLVAAQPLDAGPHWVKVIYSQNQNQPMIVAATLDNRDAPEMTAAVQKLKWPPREQFYMVKQFIVVK